MWHAKLEIAGAAVAAAVIYQMRFLFAFILIGATNRVDFDWKEMQNIVEDNKIRQNLGKMEYFMQKIAKLIKLILLIKLIKLKRLNWLN